MCGQHGVGRNDRICIPEGLDKFDPWANIMMHHQNANSYTGVQQIQPLKRTRQKILEGVGYKPAHLTFIVAWESPGRLAKAQISGPAPQSLWLRIWILGGARKFAFQTSSQVMLMLQVWWLTLRTTGRRPLSEDVNSSGIKSIETWCLVWGDENLSAPTTAGMSGRMLSTVISGDLWETGRCPEKSEKTRLWKAIAECGVFGLGKGTYGKNPGAASGSVGLYHKEWIWFILIPHSQPH